jgi:hypothetical protein
MCLEQASFSITKLRTNDLLLSIMVVRKIGQGCPLQANAYDRDP